MDERQKVVKKTFTKAQLRQMSVEDLVTLIGEAGPGATFKGTAVVRKAAGDVKYDDPEQKGNFAEIDDGL